jgi:DNA-binding NtrC family response regulator
MCPDASSGEIDMARVLVIDDEAELLDLYRDILRRANHTVVVASGARQGLALYRSQRPDLVIADVFLPDASGLDLILELTRDHATPLIAVSGGSRGSVDLLEAARMFGAFRALAKPVRREELLGAVDQALAAGRRRVDRPA